MSDRVTREIRREIYKAIQHLGGQSDILGIIGSWGDTLPDEQILAFLRDWNDGKTMEQLESQREQ